jgi:hypothetical protein
MPSLLALALAASAAGLAPAPADSVRTERDVRLTALRNAGSVTRCYVDEGLRRATDLAGVVEVELTIEATGIVSEARVSSATLRGPGAYEVAACIATVARQWRFERGPFDVETVVFPFVLVPEKGTRAGRRATE